MTSKPDLSVWKKGVWGFEVWKIETVEGEIFFEESKNVTLLVLEKDLDEPEDLMELIW